MITRQHGTAEGLLCYYADKHSSRKLGSRVGFVLPIVTSATINNAKVGNLSDLRRACVFVSLHMRMFLTLHVFPVLGDALLMGF